MLFSRLNKVTRLQGVLLFLTLTGCANGQLGNFFEVRFSPDASISQGQGTVANVSISDCTGAMQKGLPTDFPAALCYPSSVLLESEAIPPANTVSARQEGASETNRGEALGPGFIVQTTWQTDIAISEIQRFYQTFFDTNNWVTTRLPNELNNAGLFQATKDGDRITIRFNDFANQPNAGPSDPSGLIAVSRVQPHTYGLEYRLRDDQLNNATASIAESSSDGSDTGVARSTGDNNSSANTSNNNSNNNSDNAPGQASSGGAILARGTDPLTASEDGQEKDGDRPSNNASESITDASETADASTQAALDQVPPELKSYVTDILAAKDVLPDLTTALADENQAGEALRPNSPISRREFVRWLFSANNRMYGDRPTKQLRLGSTTSEPAFSDISVSDPDFAIIQGLAEAGLIPSRLSGASSAEAEAEGGGAEGDETGISFQPDAPLTREDLIAWKAPLDQQGALPQGTVAAIQESWGFKDADKIDAATLNAILADYENGDRSNIRRAFGYTLLLQPQKVVTQAEAIAVLWYFGTAESGVSVADLLNPPDDVSEEDAGSASEGADADENPSAPAASAPETASTEPSDETTE